LSKSKTYDKVLQGLKEEFDVLMNNYLQRLHNAYHKDYGLKDSHSDIINKIKQDCMFICSDTIGKITSDDRSEEQVIKEILEYNYDQTDIRYMKEVEKIDLFSQLNTLNENCIKRSDPEWFQYGIHELIQNGKVDPGAIGSKRTQFCKCCGKQVYVSNSTGRVHCEL
jgi:hypothetical protein